VTRACVARACALALALPCAARAQQTPPPATPAVVGYVGSGSLVVQSALAGIPLTVGSKIALEIRGQRLRIDILSIGLPGGDATTSSLSSALATQVLPPGGFTAVVDKSTGTFTLWSTAKKTYFVATSLSGIGHATAPAPAPSPSPTARPDPDSGDLFSVFKMLETFKKDKSFSASIALSGHTMLFGHPVTGLHYEIVDAPLSGQTGSDVHGDIQLADDIDEVPIEFTTSVSVKGIPPSSLRLDIPQLTRSVPPVSDFAPPAGYVKAASLFDVLGGKFPMRPAAP
jgi:hypothetical protein